MCANWMRLVLLFASVLGKCVGKREGQRPRGKNVVVVVV